MKVGVSTVIVKLASRCNLDCDYCYIYHGQDSSWRHMPRVMSQQVIGSLLDSIEELYVDQATGPLIVFHGGEPLLFGIERFTALVDQLLSRVPRARVCLQSNGTVYNRSLEELLVRYRTNISFSVSVDGFQTENDRHRLRLNGATAYPAIEATIRAASSKGVLDNILMVVDLATKPRRAYEFMKWAGAKSYNLLLRDGDHVALPHGKTDRSTTEAGEWLLEVLALYTSETPSFRITIFDDIVGSLLGAVTGQVKPAATYCDCVLTVDTDGTIKQADTLRINGEHADSFGDASPNICRSSLRSVATSFDNLRAIEVASRLPRECMDCHFLDVCGGGYVQHRFDGRGYDSPSIYCADYKHLFQAVERALC